MKNNMRKNLLAILLSSLTLAVAGCDNPTNSDSNPSEVASSSQEESVSEEISSSEESSSENSSILEDEYYKVPDWAEVQVSCGVGGDLIDIAVGKKLVTNCEYSISYSFSNLPNESGKETVESSNPNVIELQKSGTTYKMLPKHAGKAFIRITDSNGIIRLCMLAEVADPIPYEDMEEYLVYDADYWKSYAGYGDTFAMTFYVGGELSLTGSLSNEAFVIEKATYEFSKMSDDGKEYQYKFTDTTSTGIYGFAGFNISTNGDFIYLLSRNGLDGILIPSDKDLGI